MKKKIVLLFLLSTLLLNAASLLATVRLPALFADNMVLQQKTDVMIWGSADVNSNVEVTTSWNQKSYQTKVGSNGNWKLRVSTPQAGGPYEVSISDGTVIKLKNVLIGEVWLCSGQSNMYMPMKGFVNQPVLGSAEAIASSANSQIRLFAVKTNSSLVPLGDVAAEWNLCEPAYVENFSATAYFFGLMLSKNLNVPIGLIHASWGGTRIEPWISEIGIKKFDWVNLPKKAEKGSLSKQTPTVLFNAMINPLVGYGIRGAIWYQGESNRGEPKKYEKLLPGLIGNWRNLWAIGDFPFYYIQVAPYDYKVDGVNSADLREAQLKASAMLPNIAMASIMDIGEEHIIHPSEKRIGAQRLALIALEKTYGVKGIQSGSPVLKEKKISGSTAKLTFNNAPLGLTSYGKEPKNFEIAGADRQFYPAKAVIVKDGMEVSATSVEKPVAVRYAYKDFVIGDLFGVNGFPVSSFRTDSWD